MPRLRPLMGLKRISPESEDNIRALNSRFDFAKAGTYEVIIG